MEAEGRLEILKREWIDLVVTDYNMPDMNGLELLNEMKKDEILKAIPVVVIIGTQFGALMGGAVVTETVFGWPGIGRLAVQAIKTGDIPVVQASVIILAFMIIMVNLLADIITAFLDPRIKFG